MFTGIVEKTGTIERLTREKGVYGLAVRTTRFPDPVKDGDSMAINGVCLTSVGSRGNTLFFKVMDKTFHGTTFARSVKNEVVNIERALKLQSRIDGHFVLGHADGVRRIESINKGSRPHIEIKILSGDRTLVAEKGSIAIDGISLTIAGIRGETVRAYLIPFTMEHTSLKNKKKGAYVNVEFDILGKYATAKKSGIKYDTSVITGGFLKDKGFTL